MHACMTPPHECLSGCLPVAENCSLSFYTHINVYVYIFILADLDDYLDYIEPFKSVTDLSSRWICIHVCMYVCMYVCMCEYIKFL
jgi:hypothetical protein